MRNHVRVLRILWEITILVVDMGWIILQIVVWVEWMEISLHLHRRRMELLRIGDHSNLRRILEMVILAYLGLLNIPQFLLTLLHLGYLIRKILVLEMS
jgi:hypothetical protein